MDDAAARNLLAIANAAIARRDWSAAYAPLHALHAAYPQHAPLARSLSTVLNNLARAQLERDPAQADAWWQRALGLWPDNAEALFNRAEAARARGDIALSLSCLERLCALHPDDIDAQLALAELEILAQPERASARLSRLGKAQQTWRPEQRLRWLQACLDGGADELAQQAMAHADSPHLESLAHRAWQNGLPSCAQAACARLATLHEHGHRTPGLRAAIASRLGLPEVYRDRDELHAARARYEHGLDEIEHEFDSARLRACARDLAQWQWTNFLLAYQGQNDRALQSRYGDWLTRGLATTPACADPRAGPRRAGPWRIGLLSSAFRECTVGAYFGVWPAALRGPGREVTVLQLGPSFDAVTTRIGAAANALIRLEGTLEAMAEHVRALHLDLLIFPDPAADARVMVLAGLRLARHQAAAWGHPVTTGLPSIETFFSCAEMEPPDASTHYRERLLLLPGLGTQYARPVLPRWLTRDQLGLPRGRLYLVPQSPYKLHPDSDDLLAEIAMRDAQATLVLYEANRPHATHVMRQRLQRALHAQGADAARQVLFLPQTSRERFLQICRACDVMVDTPHWSGGNTAIDALLCDVPIVTCPGPYMRGRQSLAMLTRLGLDQALSCTGTAQLAARAVAIASDREQRANIAHRIAEGRESLFDGAAALRALHDAAAELIEKS